MRRVGMWQGLCLALLAAQAAHADVKLPAVFGNHMVIQRGIKVPIWGTAAPGERVTITLGTLGAVVDADANGRWTARVGPFAPGGPLEMWIVSASGSATIHDVMVGDVWVCSGQSNMEMGIAGVRDGADEIAAANYPAIRLFTVAKDVAPEPRADVKGSWERCSPQTVGTGGWGGFSAVAYFFGRELYRKLGVPVGLIHTSWGGTPAESWTSRKWLESDPDLAPMLSRIPQPGTDTAAAQREYERKLAAWQAVAQFQDPGNRGESLGWARPEADLTEWREMKLPGAWETNTPALAIDGAVWFRRVVEVPAALAGKDLTLSLGAIDDFDATYFNGRRVGGIGPENPNAYAVPRSYAVPGLLVRAGSNVIAVRVFDRQGAGGFTGQPAEMLLAPAGAPATGALPLAGAWRFRVEVSRNEKDVPAQPQQPAGVWNSWTPTGLYNAMIAPLVPFGIEGAIWYQGESNAGRAYQYRKLFPAMIRSWREAWGEGDFPFLFVQLANFTPRLPQPAESDWAELREAQSMTLALPRTGMAVIVDIGDADDIHPKNKQDVGKRLAVAGEAVAYGSRSVGYPGPAYRAMSVVQGSAIVTFDHLGGGLTTPDGAPLQGFAVAGADRKFVWAEAHIDGDTVVVSSPQVPSPVAVRYAWANNPACNLYTKAGLPVSPFRTDAWPGVTVKNR